MKIKKVLDLKENEKVAIDVYDYKGNQLLKTNTILKNVHIEKLKKNEIPYIYVKDINYHVNYIFDMKTRAELLKVLYYFYISKGKNEEIIKRYSQDEIKKFLFYNNETGKKIAYGHIFKYFINELIKQLKDKKPLYYDFLDYRTVNTYYFFHMVNVCCISLIIGKKIGLNDDDLLDLGVGALLYDFHMLLYKFVNENKKLTDTETEEMRQHVYLGFDSIRKIYGLSAKSANIAYQHHERINGSGYPKKLGGNEITLLSKIVSVADVYDALISDRPFRKYYFSDEAWSYIVENGNILFDLEVVNSFKKVIPKYLPGYIVKLNNQKEAIILSNNYSDMERPNIKIIEKRDISDIILGKEINLLLDNDIHIVNIVNFI